MKIDAAQAFGAVVQVTMDDARKLLKKGCHTPGWTFLKPSDPLIWTLPNEDCGIHWGHVSGKRIGRIISSEYLANFRHEHASPRSTG